MNAPAEHAARLLATIKDAFGEHPDDLLLKMRVAVDTLNQLEALFSSIEAALERQGTPNGQAIQLAEVGAYLAIDRANLIDCAIEKYRDRLLSHGIDCGGEQ